MALSEEDYVRISLRKQAFRVSFEEPFRAVFALTVVGAVILFLYQGVTSYVVLGLAIPVITGIMTAAAIEIIRRRYLFYISPEGLSCYNFWGLQRTIPWDAMRTVRRFNLFGLSYLRITADHLKSDIWLPLFVDRYALLSDLIGAHVDKHHPLAEQLHLADPAA